ncbi:MAG TPA: hypothetical protein VGD51_17050, partial [Nocardioidaceae bacterium]
LGAASGGWTIDVANNEFWDKRGNYSGAQPESKWDRLNNRPASDALPFGTSYETFRNPGEEVTIDFTGDPVTVIEPHTPDTHWWAGYESQTDHVLNVDAAVTGGDTVSFWNWHFIEEGWDYGFVEALVGGDWVTVPVTDVATGAVVSTDEDPHGNNTEGNGITGTSGGAYFVDEPRYVEYKVTVPEGASDLRFRYSTDAAYLDTGWFIDDVKVNGADTSVSAEQAGDWVETTGHQDNNWVLQVISSCDLTPGETIDEELVDDAGNFVYRFEGSEISTGVLDTACARTEKTDFVVAISNLPTGALTMLDAGYDYTVTNLRSTSGSRPQR